MTRHTRIGWLVSAACFVLVTSLTALQPDAVGNLTGVVRSPAGPEAGVWVIAETDDLDTRFRKIVVTDDDGRFLVPDLPGASYRVWVRPARPGRRPRCIRPTTGMRCSNRRPLTSFQVRAQPATGSLAGYRVRLPGSTSPSRAVSCVTRWAIGSPLTPAISPGSIRRSRPGITA